MTEQHRARKRFGQNFLVDETIIGKIIAAIAPRPTDNLIEIGPGLGALTAPLLEHCGKLTAIELDRDLAALLQEKFISGLEVLQQDALKFDFTSLATKQPLRIAGNLPYNISTPLIFHLLRYRTLITDMHFMLQKEVVDRLAAAPGSKTYGRLSVMVQYYCKVQPLFNVPPGAFRPAPKVTSAIVRLIPHSTPPYSAENENILANIVKLSFQQRRKTLRNALKLMVSTEVAEACLAELSINPKVRPEELSVMEFVALSNQLTQSLHYE